MVAIGAARGAVEGEGDGSVRWRGTEPTRAVTCASGAATGPSLCAAGTWWSWHGPIQIRIRGEERNETGEGASERAVEVGGVRGSPLAALEERVEIVGSGGEVGNGLGFGGGG